MFNKASLIECLNLHRSAANRYEQLAEKSVNGTRLECESRLAQHQRCLTLLSRLIHELESINRVTPKLNEVIDYGAGIGMSKEECEDWFDWMQTFGWKLMGYAVEDWQAAMRRERRGKIKRKHTNRVVKKDDDPALWREYLSERGKPYEAYRFAPGTFKTGFARWEKTRLVHA